jgi:hypothetical protein
MPLLIPIELDGISMCSDRRGIAEIRVMQKKARWNTPTKEGDRSQQKWNPIDASSSLLQ